MRVEQLLDSVHRRTVETRILQLFTAFLRVLLAFAFVPPSIPKIMHRPFTLIPESDPVGAYFAALYRTGYYYDFLGWSQLTAALLLFIPRTSHIGAILFFPIIVNITVLTNSVGFRGTWLVTLMMSAASLYLVCWDYPRWKSILFVSSSGSSRFSTSEYFLVPLVFGVGGTLAFFGLATFWGTIGTEMIYRLAVIFAIGSIFGIAVAVQHRFMKISPETDGSL